MNCILHCGGLKVLPCCWYTIIFVTRFNITTQFYNAILFFTRFQNKIGKKLHLCWPVIRWIYAYQWYGIWFSQAVAGIFLPVPWPTFLCIRFGMILITQIRIFSKRVIYICPPMQVAIYCTSIFLLLSTSIKHTTYNIPGRDQCKLKLCVYIMFINDSLRLTYIVNNYKYGSIIVLWIII